MEEKNVLSNFKFILCTTVILGLIFSAVVITVLNMYKPTFRVKIDDKFIGYFGAEEQFEEVYNTLVSEQEQIDPNVKVYLKNEPTYESCYIRDNLIAKQNVYSSLRSEIKTEFTIYNVAINNEKKMTFNNQDAANKYVTDLKKEIPKVKTEVISEKVDKLGEMTSIELANNIFQDIVSRNKPVIIPRVKYYPPASTTKSTASTAISNVSAAQGGIWPAATRYISSPFGWRGASMHTGIDLAGPTGTPVFAYKSGLVVFAGWSGAYGNMLKIDHGNGVATWYAHSSRLLVSAGDTVQMGQIIMKIGNTGWSSGPHLHFEIRVNGTPLNPYGYIAGK